MKKNINIVCFILICIPFKGLCQANRFYDDDEVKLVTVSIGAGGFRAGKHVANYYNGHPNNVNKISYILGNSHWHEHIRREEFDGRDFRLNSLPDDMSYRIATAMTVRFALNLSPYTSVFLQVNQVNLLASDVFVIKMLESSQLVSEPDLRPFRIWGRESRSMLDIGFQRRDELEARNWYWFYELGFNVTNTRVRENSIQIGNFQQSIIDRGTYHPGQGFSTIEDPQTAFGIGLIGTVGWQYVITPSASFDFGVTAYLQDINLEGYNKFHTNFNIFARLNLLMF
jgi:hypothetical protein